MSTNPDDRTPQLSEGLDEQEYRSLRALYAKPGANYGYNVVNLPSLSPFPDHASFHHSTPRLNAATMQGDKGLDHVLTHRGREAALQEARKAALDPPDWIDMTKVRAGQRIGRRYFSCLAMTLGNLSLIGGFGASKINRVLVRGSRLSQSSSGRGYDPLPRLVETAAWLLEVLRSVEPYSVGFEETLKVRALHSMIRAHLLEQGWDSERLDFPLNQEQMLSTLMGFSYNGVWGLRRMGIRITAEEAEQYIHLWAYIGHILGIDDALLPRSFEHARATTLQLLPRILSPDDDTRQIIQNLHRRRNMRLGLPYSVQSAMCRFFLPHPYADALGLHGTPWVDHAVHYIYRGLGNAVSFIGQRRPDSLEQWEITRVSRRLETVLGELRQSQSHPPQEGTGLTRAVLVFKELSRALLTV